MAPGCNIIALKVFPDGGGSAFTSDIREALDWVVANRAAYNIVSVNMSLGEGNNVNTPTTSSYASEFANLAANNCAVVVASGNDYFKYQTQGVASPSADPNAWSVGAGWDRDAGSGWFWGSGAVDNTARLWDVATRRLVAVLPHAETLFAVAFSPDGVLATQDALGNITLWDAITYRKQRSLRRQCAPVGRI